MENASKALLMAAGVLIGILILSLAVYLFISFGSASADAHRQIAQNQVEKFNIQFTSYEGRTDVTIHDIVTVANLARSSNDTYELTGPSIDTDGNNTNYYITVRAKTATGWKKDLQNCTTSELNELINDDMDSLVYNPVLDSNGNPTGETTPALRTYTCRVTISPATERVSEVEFINNN